LGHLAEYDEPSKSPTTSPYHQRTTVEAIRTLDRHESSNFVAALPPENC
jgi:hypothetical protein